MRWPAMSSLPSLPIAAVSLLALAVVLAAGAGASPSEAAVGDQVHQITVPVSGADAFCSIGLAFDGSSLYYDRCEDSNIYRINPVTAALEDTFDTGIAEFPNALAFDAKRNGLWIGGQACDEVGMPIYFWDFDDDSVTSMFTIPSALTNPATDETFVNFCFVDGLAYNENDPASDADDEIWFSDDVNPNLGLFRPDGTLVNGYDATTIDASLSETSGLAIGGPTLYLGNDGGGDVFRADKSADPLTLVSQFTSGDDRQEDMECDLVTFAPIEVMWVRTTPQGGAFPDVITAFEIEPGTCGVGGQEPQPITLDPATATNTVGEDHTVTATVQRAGDPVVGADVTFTITDGPNAGDTATDTTDASGQATFTYTGDGGAGIDTIEACFSEAAPTPTSTPTPEPTPTSTPEPTPTSTPQPPAVSEQPLPQGQPGAPQQQQANCATATKTWVLAATPTPVQSPAALPPTGGQPTGGSGSLSWLAVAMGAIALVGGGGVWLAYERRRAR